MPVYFILLSWEKENGYGEPQEEGKHLYFTFGTSRSWALSAPQAVPKDLAQERQVPGNRGLGDKTSSQVQKENGAQA